MNIFQFDTQDHQAYLFAGGVDRSEWHADPPRSLALGWKPPVFELVTDDEYRDHMPVSDFPTLGIATMVLSARAVDRLRPLLETCGEILPIRLSNARDQLYLFNVTKVLDAIDMQRSEFLRFPDGRVMWHERLVFDPRAIPDEPLFFVTTQMGAVVDIYATERAVAAVNEAQLTGYEFRLVGSD